MVIAALANDHDSPEEKLQRAREANLMISMQLAFTHPDPTVNKARPTELSPRQRLSTCSGPNALYSRE